MSELAVVAGLRHPRAYPWPVKTVQVIETHISWVFLAGDRVLKVKRPVDYGFVDYTTPAKRYAACLDEVRLNRRLTSGVYCATVSITREADGFRVGGSGEVVEWATLMRRLPAERMLDTLIAHGDLPSDLGDRLARRLVPFHLALAPQCEGIAADLARDQTAVVTDNLAELTAFRGNPLGSAQLDMVTEAMRRFTGTHAPLLHSRVAQGWVREGHGDLRCEHVCLETDGGTQIFDCVEFNRDLRCADVASDLAFLLMDLHRLGAPVAVTETLLQRYRDAGANLPVVLLRFYWVHRALVRAKVSCLRWAGVRAGTSPTFAE